jgi:hypothetical protein
MDRGLRLAEKRQLPLGRERRQKWLDTRDKLYEEIQVRCSTVSLLSVANNVNLIVYTTIRG